MYYGVRYCDPVFERFIAPERIVPGAGALTAAPHDAVAQLAWAQGGGTPTTTTSPELNRYAYAQSTPLRCTDPTRHWIERAVDIAFIADDIWDIHQNGLTWDNGLALAADVGGLLLPGLTGGGLLVRAATHADDVAAGALHAAAHADDAADAARAAAQGGEAAGAVGRTVARDGDPTDEVRDAYAIATRGGKHAGLLQTYAGRSEKEIRKAIRSFERVADLHRRKLANPEQYAEQWEHMSPERRERLLVYWRREVAVYTEQADVLRGLLDHMQH